MISLLKRKDAVPMQPVISSTTIEIDACFYTFAEFEVVKRAYEQEHKVNLSTQHSTHLKNEDFKIFRYKYARYSCNRGGRTYNAERERKRNTSSILVGCPMYFKLGFQEKRRRLTIISMIGEHSSECMAMRSQIEFARTTPQRRISGALRDEVKRMMAVGADKRAVLAHLTKERHKMVTMKDLFNIAYDNKRAIGEKLTKDSIKTQSFEATKIQISESAAINKNPDHPASASAPVGARMYLKVAATAGVFLETFPPPSSSATVGSGGDTVSDDSTDVSGGVTANPPTKDAFSAFGEYVAEELRTVADSFLLQVAKHRINEILFEATTGQYRIDQATPVVVEDRAMEVIAEEIPSLVFSKDIPGKLIMPVFPVEKVVEDFPVDHQYI